MFSNRRKEKQIRETQEQQRAQRAEKEENVARKQRADAARRQAIKEQVICVHESACKAVKSVPRIACVNIF